MFYLSTILLSVFLTISLIPMMTRLAERFHMVDFPNPRKVHTQPVPRIGGFAMAIGTFIPVILWASANNFVKAYLAGAGILVLFGLLDDMKGLGYKTKFTGQVLAAIIAVVFGGVKIASLGTLLPGTFQLPEWFAVILSLVAIVGVTNAINLADGLDGLAGGISLLGFCCIGYLAYIGGNSTVILISLSLAGAIFGFLRYNTHPATLFMGDTGSQLLGFSAVVLSIKITQGNTPYSPLLPLFILGFPVLDTLTVMAERIRTGRSPFSADKNHFHHRLVRFGLYHTEAVFTIYVIQALMIVSAIYFKYYSDWTIMASYLLLSVFVVGAFAGADRTGFKFARYPLIDNIFMGKLRKLKDDKVIIRAAFSLLKLVLPFLFLWSCLIPADIPFYVTVMTGCFSICILTVRIFANNHMGFWLRFVLYLTMPLLLYLIEGKRIAWMSGNPFIIYQVFFGIIAFLMLLVVKYSRRIKGFKVTTMDFLIIFIAVVVPNLPDHSIQSYQLGQLAVKIVVILFSYEVLIKELRGRFESLVFATLAALILISSRGLSF